VARGSSNPMPKTAPSGEKGWGVGGGAGRARSSCWQCGAGAGPSPHGREQAWLRRVKTPRPRPDRITSFGIALTGHPSSHALPSGGGHELSCAAHRSMGGATPGGGRALSRARAQLGRPRAQPFEGLTTPAARPSQWSRTRPVGAACPRAVRLSTPASARGRGRACERHGERTGRRVRCFSTRVGGAVWLGMQAWRCGRGIRPGLPATRLPRTPDLQEEESQRTSTTRHHAHHGHPLIARVGDAAWQMTCPHGEDDA